jgi:hypothetical protein
MKLLTAIALLGGAAAMMTSANAGVVLTNVDPAIILASASVNSDTQASIEFINRESYQVDIYWVDYGGNLVYYNYLTPGASYIQGTFITHPWLAFADSTHAPITGFASAVTPDPGWTGLSPDIANIGTVPEPSTWALMLLGAAGLGFTGYRRNKPAASAV